MKLQQLIESYISYRQALGARFQTNTSVLRAFGRAIGTQADASDVRDEQVTVFLAGAGSVTSSWHIKYSALLGFYRYATSRGYTADMPLPTVLPNRPPTVRGPTLIFSWTRPAWVMLNITGLFWENFSHGSESGCPISSTTWRRWR